MSVSPSCNVLRQREREGRVAVAPDKLSSLNTVLHPARFKAASWRQGSGRRSIRERRKTKLKGSITPLTVLAELPLPVYMTTNYDSFMFEALCFKGKDPRLELCRWNEYVSKKHKSIFDSRPSFAPKPRHSHPLALLPSSAGFSLLGPHPKRSDWKYRNQN
jgi:hypothetical protein